MFRNYMGVFVFVTYRIAGLITGFNNPLPFIFELLTFASSEILIRFAIVEALKDHDPPSAVAISAPPPVAIA